MQDVTTQLRESQKEADRDLWEQQNNQMQSVMMVGALLLAGAFQLCVEGQLPPHSGNLLLLEKLLPNEDGPRLVVVYYFAVGGALSLLLMSILSAVIFTTRMSRYMFARTFKQQRTLRELRKIAYTQLERMYNDEKGQESNRAETYTRELKEMRKDFSRRLWGTPVLYSDWKKIQSGGRHIVGFEEWYEFNGDSLFWITKNCFEGGAMFLMFAIGLYVEAHLVNGDEDEEERSEVACAFFWAFIVVTIACLLLSNCSERLNPGPDIFNRERRDTEGKREQEGSRGGVQATAVKAAEGQSSVGTSVERGRRGHEGGRASGGGGVGGGGVGGGGGGDHDTFDDGMEVEVYGLCGGKLDNGDVGCIIRRKEHSGDPNSYCVQMRKDGKRFIIKAKHLRVVPPKSSNIITRNLHFASPPLDNVNVFDMHEESKELYKDLDLDGNSNLSMQEICTVLGFEEPKLEASSERVEEPEELLEELDVDAEVDVRTGKIQGKGMWEPGKIIKRNEDEVCIGFPEQRKVVTFRIKLRDSRRPEPIDIPEEDVRPSKVRKSVYSAHERLRKHPMLQEAVFDLLDRLLHKKQEFVALKAKDSKKAEGHRKRLKTEAENALKLIREKEIESLNQAVKLTTKDPHLSRMESPDCDGASDAENDEGNVTHEDWSKIMNTIFLEKLF